MIKYKKTQPLSLSSLTGILIFFISSLSFSAPQVIDRVVAVVDKKVVAMSQLEERIAGIHVRAQQAGMRLPPADILQKQVLDQLISETLQFTMAERYDLRIPDEEINAAVENIAQQREWTTAQLEQNVIAEGKTMATFREELRKEMLLHRISQGVVRSRIKVSEQEIDNFLRSAEAQFWISPDYRLGHILISLPQSPSQQQIVAAEERANRVYQQLKDGARFDEMAIAESSGPAALNGGDLGFRKSSELPTLFAEVVPTLEVSGISKPARSQAGFHILKLIDKKGETKQIVQQVKVRHILLKTSAILTDDKAKAKLNEIREKILAEEVSFEAMAKKHSEDIGSKLSGGDLGWSEPNIYVPRFKAMVKVLEVGTLSEPFQTNFGWHIAEVLDRRDEDMTDEAIRMKAQELLTNRRFEDETQVWLQEMRDNAFIEVKI